MHPTRRIEGIRSALERGEAGAVEIRKALRVLETKIPTGEILVAVGADEFTSTLITRSKGCSAEVEDAWLTIAAAGQRWAAQVLAWPASESLGAEEVAEVYLADPLDSSPECRRRARRAEGVAARGAWSVLSLLTGTELRRLVHGRPSLSAALSRAQATAVCSEVPSFA